MRYVFGYDGSEYSRQALDAALSLISPTERDELVVLSVVEATPTYDWPFMDEEEAARSTKRKYDIARQSLKNLEDTILLKRFPAGQTGAKTGVPTWCTVIKTVVDTREGFVQEVEALGADMLVMGTRGGSALKRLALGSVSDFAIRNAKLPVLVIPPGYQKQERIPASEESARLSGAAQLPRA